MSLATISSSAVAGPNPEALASALPSPHNLTYWSTIESRLNSKRK
jgi:hypothetical protein